MAWVSIRGGSGLGDSLYIQPLARYLVQKGKHVEIRSWFPDVFLPLIGTGKAKVVDFRRGNADYNAHYVRRKEIWTSDQFEDGCIAAGLPKDIDMQLDWEVVANRFNSGILNAARGRPIIAVNFPRRPAGKAKEGDIYWEMEPGWSKYQELVSRISKHALVVQIGAGECRCPLTDIEIDLANRTTVVDLLDVASICDGFFSWCSFVVPLAESLNMPGLYLWAARGLESRDKWTRLTTPQKVLHRPASRFILDNASEAAMELAVDDLLEQARHSPAVRREIGGDRRERAGCAA